MSKSLIDKSFGREAFGLDPAGYHAARPGYPEWVYETLRDNRALNQHSATFEIGPGTGLATYRLLELGANPLTAIEPDSRLADFLSESLPEKPLVIIRSTFEEAELPQAAFDLGFCATAFHWLDEASALKKVAGLLKPGGWWVMVWNVYGDPSRADAFHEATKDLLAGPVGPSRDDQTLPFGLDSEARLTALTNTGAFDSMEYRTGSWSMILDAEEIVNLYSTYSVINIRPDRDAVLAGLRRIARDEFQDRVTRNMITSLYMARRKQ